MKKEDKIKDEKKKEEKKKKRKLKWQFKLILLIITIILYAFFIGTKGIFVKEFKVESKDIQDNFHGLKIAQFSDVHYGSSINEFSFKSMIKKINRTKPDIIIFTGDLIDKDYEISNKEIEMIKKELTLLNAELGKYYITGEEDKEKSISLLNEAGFTNLNTDVQYIYNNTKKPILLAGKDTLNNKESIIETKDFKILALHNPSYADKYKEYNFDMIVSGHTHNGQINIPKIKDLLIKGKHKKNYQKIDNTELYINPGIGTNKPNARLFNHPTIYLYRLNKASTN